MINFTQNVLTDVDNLQSVFTKYFDQHIAMYYLASTCPVSVTSEVNSATIVYIVKPNMVEELKHVIESISTPVTVGCKTFFPELEVKDDSLYVILRDTRKS